MPRNILFITTDQQRYDSLGCNGNTFARTPVIDGLATRRHQLRARLQPEHGVHAGALDDADRSVCAHPWRLRERRAAAGRCAELRAYLNDKAGYKTALIGKAHFEPGFDPRAVRENRRQRDGDTGRGAASTMRSTPCTSPRFGDSPVGHYGRWLPSDHPGVPDSVRAAARAPRPAATPARRRPRTTRSRASSITPTGSPICRSTGSTRWQATTTGSCGSASPTRITRGIRRSPR